MARHDFNIIWPFFLYERKDITQLLFKVIISQNTILREKNWGEERTFEKAAFDLESPCSLARRRVNIRLLPYITSFYLIIKNEITN